MTSRPGSRLGDLFLICLPRRTRASSDPSPFSSPVNDSAPPTAITSTQVVPTASIPLEPIASTPKARTPLATKSEPSPAIGALKTVLEGLRSSLNGLPPVQLAVGGFLECILHVEVEAQHRQAYDQLARDLASLATILQKHVVESKPRNAPYSIANVARAITEQTKIIQEHQNRSKISRLAAALEDDEVVLKCYRQIGAMFQQLQVDISLSIWDAVREQQMDTRLKDLSPVHKAYYNAGLSDSATQQSGCTEHTRVELLETTRNWSRERDGPQIFWLNGMAGTGKTTIAYTVCKMLQEENRLGGSFFCSRNSPDCRNFNRIVPTIAYQLGRYSNPYRQALCNILDADPDIGEREVSMQFEQLISKPLAEIGKAMPTDVVVVIDALDECEDVGGTRQVLDMLVRHAGGLPIKFFVSSRPEPVISSSMTTNGGPAPSILRLHDIAQSLVQADIRHYLTKALSSIQITPSELDQLVAQSGSLFIFAATSVRYIIPSNGSVDHRQRLEVVLRLKLNPSQGHKSYEVVDGLYHTILSSAFDPKAFEENELGLRKQVLWTVVCAREVLTVSALAEVLQTSNDRAVELAIQPLQSVLYVSEGTKSVSTLHASFPDFLLSKERAERLCCDRGSHEMYLADCCFKLMNRSLRFNICNLESSYKFNSNIPGLQDRVAQNISTGLFYACRYWSDHLTRNPATLPLLSLVELFLESRLLFWMEVLSLKGMIGHGEIELSRVLAWLPGQDVNTRLHDFTYDARNFLTTFAGNPTTLSAPHIYISVLPFTSKQSLVHSTYWPQTEGLICVEGGAMDTRRESALATWDVGSGVKSLALSHDGKRVASGSYDGGVGVWDVSSGTLIQGPLKGHEISIWSVAYSSDGTRIASGSWDNTICIWDARQGVLTADPLHGHTKAIRSVAFSPDGSHLASGSSDQTIRIWHANSGVPVGEPLEAHQGGVWSIAFSPDGEHLASGSDDSTIRVWDWEGRTMAQGKFEGHAAAVYSIGYSGDGHRLVSGSEDRTVRVWDALNGTLLVGPFEGHTSTVSCVSFSPNGTRVVSGSSDGTLRVWDAMSGMSVAGPFEGRGGGINAVLFTTDGTRILSGSDDGTIRVWDVRHAKTGTTEPQEHTSGILSVALSPDGRRLASGSDDNTVCVWDVHNGALVAGPLKAHTGWVCSVAFSPDGARIVSGSSDHALNIWDTATSTLIVVAETFKGHTGEVVSIAFSPDGARIISSSYDGTVRMWDINNGTTLWTSGAHTNYVRCVAFSPDGTRVVSGSEDKTILVLDAGNGGVLHGPFTGHTEIVMSVAFSLDGTRVVSGSYDQTVRVWDVERGVTVAGPIIGHTGPVRSVAFSADGARVISADNTVRIWDLAAVAQANGSDDWSIDDDGWLINSESQRLFWVPPDLRPRFRSLTSSTPIVMNADCTTRIESSTLLGDRWRSCWRSSSASS